MTKRWPWHRDQEPVRDAGYWHRTAYEKLQRSSATEASRAARYWAEWAAAQVDAGRENHVGEAADAHAALVKQFARELARRTDPAEIRRYAAGAQGLAAEAGYWLTRADRVAEAVTAVESARALLLSTRVQRLPDDLRQRLVAARRGALFDQYREAERELDRIERAEYTGQHRPSGEARATGNLVLTGQRLAWSRFQAVRQDVAAALGESGDPAGEVTWDRGNGRLAYLAAAERGGYALILDGDAQPRQVQLPALTAGALLDAVKRFAGLLAAETQDGESWRSLLGWLGAQVMDPVLRALAETDSLVLVPLAGLAVLPLHAAVLPGERGARPRYAGDAAVIRYAPNARLAVQAIRRANRVRPSLVMVAGVNSPAGIDPADVLPHAEREADLICDLLSARRCLRPEPATLAGVLLELDRSQVWHFACHGVADAADPLDSAILLADEPLRLRHLLGRPIGRHRLAVLSACRTNVPDADRLDEVIGFPGALLRTGVPGVIASQWNVGDASAVVLMQRFYQLLLAGAGPPQALCLAQRWLRDATLAQVGPLLPRPIIAPPGPPAGTWAVRPFADRPWTWAAFSYTGA